MLITRVYYIILMVEAGHQGIPHSTYSRDAEASPAQYVVKRGDP